MTSYAIRLTFCYTEVQEVIEQFGNASEGIVVYEHEKDEEVSNTHIHMLLNKCTVSTDTLKNYVRRKKGVVDKTLWSFKTADSDVDKYVTYMSKGVLSPVYVKGYDAEYIASRKQAWTAPQTKVKLLNGKLVKEVDDSSNISKRQLVEEMVASIGTDECDTRIIIDGIRKVLVQHRIVVGMYKVMDYYDSYMMYGQKERWVNMVASRIEKRNM